MARYCGVASSYNQKKFSSVILWERFPDLNNNFSSVLQSHTTWRTCSSTLVGNIYFIFVLGKPGQFFLWLRKHERILCQVCRHGVWLVRKLLCTSVVNLVAKCGCEFRCKKSHCGYPQMHMFDPSHTSTNLRSPDLISVDNNSGWFFVSWNLKLYRITLHLCLMHML